MGSKIISDYVEALVGAYYVDGRLATVIYLMKWFGMDSDIKLTFVIKVISIVLLQIYILEVNEIVTLESKLGYEFSMKGLL